MEKRGESKFMTVYRMHTQSYVLKKIEAVRDIPVEDLEKMLKHNAILVKQAAEILGCSIHRVNGLLRDGSLTKVNPFPTVTTKNSKAFVLRDEKWDMILEKSLIS